jgi:anti-sigma factor RsiW
MSCNRSSQVQAYHDSELSTAEGALVEAHVRECAACRGLLADLRGLSSAIAMAGMREPSDEAVRRFGRAWKDARDRGVIRLAGWLTAAAAAVLMAVLVGKPGGGGGEMPGQPAVWETVAATPPVEMEEDSGSDQLVMAQWMADDLSSTSRQ